MLSVVNNLGAMNAQRQFNITGASIKKSSEKLSSGYRINRSADDAAGLTISEKMRSLIRGMNQGSDNIQDGISVMQIADGALAEVHGMLHRMTELSIKAANGTNTTADRAAIQSEINELSSEITRIGKTTEFNTMHILDNGEPFVDGAKGTAADLVKCKSAKKGYMGEAYKYPATSNNYYPAAYLNFNSLNEEKIKMLADKSFSFVCGQGCNETFKFTFVEGTSGWSLSNSGKVHNYSIGIDGASDGVTLANRIYDAVSDKPIPGHSGSYLGGLYVSHAAALVKSSTPGELIVVQNPGSADHSEQAASNHFPDLRSSNKLKGSIDCSEITKAVEDDVEYVNRFNIQCSNIVDDREVIETYRMNASILGVDKVDVMTEESARAALSQIENALAKVSKHRSAYGAFQNRLEHSYDNNNNKSENLTAAESRIRDTDMAKEMVDLTKSNILSQAGSAMISQTMQNPQMVLQLLS